MRVLSVQLRDFRTYTRAEATIGEGLTVVHGPNGAGKSNLLEALYFGCTARSPRTRNERELVRFGAKATRVSVRLRDEHQAHELSVGFGTTADSAQPVKRMTADGAPVERMLDVESRPLVSVFLPDRLELIKGPPAVRRAHLDQFVAALWPPRADARRQYSRVLAQRNALLGRIRSGRASDATLAGWDVSSPPSRSRCAPTVPRRSRCSPSRSPRAPRRSGAPARSRSSTGRARARRTSRSISPSCASA